MFYLRRRDYSYRDIDTRDGLDIGAKEVTPTNLITKGEKVESDSIIQLESEEEGGSGDSATFTNSKPHKSHKKSSKTKEGTIYCICSFQCYENGMLLCMKCKRYAHAGCYGVDDISIEHICGPCSVKENINCTSESVKEFVAKPNKSQQEHSNFAFNLMLKRVMNSLLKEEFKLTQPGTELNVDFIKIQFNMSTSYANKVVLFLVQHGYITFFGGFKLDEERVKQFLYPNKDSEEGKLETSVIKSSGETNTVETSTPKESKNGGVGAKNKKYKRIFFSPDRNVTNENKVSNISNKQNEEVSKEVDGNKDSEKETSITSWDSAEKQEGSQEFRDSFSNSFTKVFLWPSRFLERESRKKDEPIEPIEVDQIGKNTKRAFYGQILESAGPRLNSSAQVGYNLVFTVGRNGESIQVWAFGEESEIMELSSLIKEETYMVFWNYEVVSKTSNKVSSTSEWAIKIAPKRRDFATVKVTRKYDDPSKAHGEQIEKFSEKFNQSANRKPMTRKKEHSFSQKRGLKTDSSQQKIHRYLQGFDEGLTLSTSSFGSGQSSSSSGSQDQRSSTPESEGSCTRRSDEYSSKESSSSPPRKRAAKRLELSSSE